MSTLLSSVEVTSLWGLVSIRDFGTDDYPQTDDGEYDCLPGHGQIYVSTRTDSDGDVEVRIHLGEAAPADMRVIYDGPMDFKSGVISVTPPAMEDRETVILPSAGIWRVVVAVSGGSRPDLVCLYLTKAP
ncbi:hypothetical protein ACWC9T_31010 [Kitasatospora sp. NPDC001159]